MPLNNLTIDFNDASFDESNTDVQGPGGVDIDVVFPISDDPNFSVARADNRTGSETSTGLGTGTASAIALMPGCSNCKLLWTSFYLEFEDNIDHDNNVNTPNRQGLKITTEGGSPGAEVINNINITGSFNDLHNGGTLDVHIDHGIHNGQPVFQTMTLGAPN